MQSFERMFVQAFDITAREVGRNAIAKGFRKPGEILNPGERIALIHAELSELLEEFRHPMLCEDAAQAELADVVIRCMDLAHERGWSLGGAIVAKMEFNATRPIRHGGKLF